MSGGIEPPEERVNGSGEQSLPLQVELQERLPDYNEVAVFHPFVDKLDGVGLELRKMAQALTLLGRNIHLIGSDVPDGVVGERIPELDFNTGELNELNFLMFGQSMGRDRRSEEEKLRFAALTHDQQEEEIMRRLREMAGALKTKFLAYINGKGIGTVHLRNLSLPFGMPAGMAWEEIIRERPDLNFIVHNHDFVWEVPGGRNYTSSYQRINDLVERVSPPRIVAHNVRHVVINSIAQESFRQKASVEAELLPDSLDFDEAWETVQLSPERIRAMRLEMGIGEDDVVVGVPQRIIRRKDIEGTLQFAAALQRILSGELLVNEQNVAELRRRENGVEIARGTPRVNERGEIISNGRLTKESKVVVVFFQSADKNEEYYQDLSQLADKLGIKVIYVGEKVAARNGRSADGREVYSFEEIYALITVMVFGSRYEAFGNQLLEGIGAMILQIVNKYPVLKADIETKMGDTIWGFDKEELRRQGFLEQFAPPSGREVLELIPEVVADTGALWNMRLLLNPREYERMAQLARERAKVHFDVHAVARKFNEVVKGMAEK